MRYSRQNILNFIPNNFIENNKNKNIILIGCGGIGSPLAQLLVRGGFLNLILVDNDLIDETNLQRQIFFEEDIGEFKVEALKKHLLKINKKIKIKIFNIILNKSNINLICSNSDLIIDCTDNFDTRETINSFCEKNKKDWLYNGAIKTEIISCLFYGENKLFSKIFKKNIKDESCCQVGVLASTTFVAASIAYNQILKYFIGIRNFELIKIDIWTNKIFNVKIK